MSRNQDRSRTILRRIRPRNQAGRHRYRLIVIRGRNICVTIRHRQPLRRAHRRHFMHHNRVMQVSDRLLHLNQLANILLPQHQIRWANDSQ